MRIGRWLAGTKLAILSGLLLGGPAVGQTLSHCLPCSVQHGQTTRVTCYGAGLATVQNLWTTFPASSRRVEPGADTAVTFEVAVPADAPIGIFALRVATADGISDPRLIVVEDLPLATRAADVGAPEKAQKLSLPAAVDGVALPERSEYYAFRAAAGQRLAFEVVGYRLGSDFDPFIRILTSTGKELVARDNDEGMGFDCRFEHVFKDAGDYLLELHDTRYQGGGNWSYHLRIGDFPVARVAYPPGGRRGRWVSVAFPGRNATDVAPVDIQVTANPMDDMLIVSARGGQGSTWVPFVADDQDQQLELEPNNDPAQANVVAFPRTLHGRLESPGDVDCYRFTAQKGQVLSFRSDTRRIGSPADLYLRLFNSAGQAIATADDAGTNDAELSLPAPADGDYVLSVEDLNRRGGLGFIYRIECQVVRTEFQLAAASDRLVVAQGSAVPVLVTAARAGYAGPIELGIREPKDAAVPAGVVAIPTKIDTNLSAAPLVVSAAADAPLGLRTIRIAGAGQVGSYHWTRSADLASVVAPKLNNLRQLPPSVARDIAVLVTPRPFFTLASRIEGPAALHFGKTPLVVQVQKDKFFDEEVKIEVENVPANVAIAPKPIAKGQRQVALEIESKAGSPMGRFPLFVSGVSTYRGRSARFYSDVLEVEFRPGFSLAIAPVELALPRGRKGSITVTADRLPGFTGPIAIEIKNLPAGVTAAPAIIAEKQSSIRVELSAAVNATAARVGNVLAQGTATIGGQAEVVASPAAVLVVP